jgi:hypothetical protein
VEAPLFTPSAHFLALPVIDVRFWSGAPPSFESQDSNKHQLYLQSEGVTNLDSLERRGVNADDILNWQHRYNHVRVLL